MHRRHWQLIVSLVSSSFCRVLSFVSWIHACLHVYFEAWVWAKGKPACNVLLAQKFWNGVLVNEIAAIPFSLDSSRRKVTHRRYCCGPLPGFTRRCIHLPEKQAIISQFSKKITLMFHFIFLFAALGTTLYNNADHISECANANAGCVFCQNTHCLRKQNKRQRLQPCNIKQSAPKNVYCMPAHLVFARQFI